MLKLIKKIFFLISFNFVFVIQAVSQEKKVSDVEFCHNINYEQSITFNPKKFEKFNVSIEIPNQRKWNKLVLSEEIIKKKENKSKYYFYQNRKRVDASLIIFSNNVKCKLDAKIRPHGDLYDHRVGSGLPSINIKLKKGHVFGAVEFILFRPKTRNYDNEVFTTTFLRELNLLAPRSTNIIVNYKGVSEKFIFQEKINKEFLENSNLREGPILEGDERFRNIDKLKTKNLSRHRISNYKWSGKSNSNLDSSYLSLSLLNKINQFHLIKSDHFTELDLVDYYSISKNLNLYDYFKDLAVYDSIMTVLNADHGLSREDRNFYFDQFYKKFQPIYYDGMVNVLSFFNNVKIDSDPSVIDLKVDLLNFDKGKIISSAVDGSNDALVLLNNLDIEKFYLKLKKNGVELELNQVEKLIIILKERLMLLKKFNKEKLIDVEIDTSVKSFADPGQIEIKDNRRLIYFNQNFKGFISCDIYGNDCSELILNQNQISKALGQDLEINNNKYIFVGKIKNNTVSEGWYDEITTFKNNNLKSRIIETYSSLNFFGDSEIYFDNINRKITLIRNNETSRFILKNGVLNNWSIELIDNSNVESVGSDINGLTGCVTFLDIELKNISIFSEKGNCEDTYNFIRSEGLIKNVNVIDSKSDAIDADFSNLKFESVNINKTVNDCLDFSYGNYFVENSFLNNCGDKGLSVGENSVANFQNIEVLNSNTGVASKDSSNTNIERLIMENVNNCLQLYNKKQEFSGARLFVRDFNCKKFTNESFVEPTSTLKIGKK